MRKLHLVGYSHGRLALKKRSLLQWMVFLVAFWSILIKPVSALSSPLGYLKYLPDGILLILLVFLLGHAKASVRRVVLPPLLIAVAFFLYAAVVYLLQYQSVAYFLWGFRNNFRFLIAFFAFIIYLDEADINTWFKTLDALFWVNAAMSVVQFMFLHARGDFLGGIFGIQGASNGYTMIFQSIVVTKSLLRTFNGTESFSSSMIKCAASIMVASMAEMKFYYAAFTLLLFGAAMITRFSGKKLILIMVSMVAVMLGSILVVNWFGSGEFWRLENFWELATKENYSSRGDINRLSAIPTLSRRVITNPLNQIFGLGLGNCDTSSFAICNTPFYRRHGHLHYTWFTSAMIFLETGYIGLGIYISFFLVCFRRAYRQYRSGEGVLLHNQLAILMSLLCCILIFYNSSLRIEPGYMMYFVLALPYFRHERPKKEQPYPVNLKPKEVR